MAGRGDGGLQGERPAAERGGHPGRWRGRVGAAGPQTRGGQRRDRQGHGGARDRRRGRGELREPTGARVVEGADVCEGRGSFRAPPDAIWEIYRAGLCLLCTRRKPGLSVPVRTRGSVCVED